MDGGGTVPWTEPVEPSREQRPRATQEAKAECTRANGNDYKLFEKVSSFEDPSLRSKYVAPIASKRECLKYNAIDQRYINRRAAARNCAPL